MSDSVLSHILEVGGGGIVGAVVAFITFRTRLAMIDRDIAEIKAEMKNEREHTERRHGENQTIWSNYMEETNRRQRMLLEVVAGIARKVGADARFSDSLLRFLTEENGG